MMDHASKANTDALAVVGMDIVSATCSGLRVFEKAVYEGREWRVGGERVESREQSTGEVVDGNDSSLLRVVSDALGGLGLNRLPDGAGVCVWAAPNEQLLSESKHSGFGAKNPDKIIDFSTRGNPLLDGYVQAQSWLAGSAVKMVVLACADERGNAAAIVLQQLQAARDDGHRIYAIIKDAASANNLPDKASVFNKNGLQPKDIGYLEVVQGCDNAALASELAGLGKVFKGEAGGLTTALHLEGKAEDESPVDALAGLIRACLCLGRRFLPASETRPDSNAIGQLKGSGFYLPDESRPWLLNRVQHGRTAGFYQAHPNGDGAAWLLVEDDSQGDPAGPALSHVEYRLFPLAANSADELFGMMKLLRIQAEKDPDLFGLSQKWFEVYQKRPAARLGLMLTGSTQEELLREIDFAQKGVSSALEKGVDWQTPSGSYFAPVPLGAEGKVCLVYPGAFNSYVGIGRELFQLFPQIYAWMKPIASDLAYVFCERYLYPRSLEPITKEELAGLENALTDDAVAMMTSGMAFSVVYTYILDKVFKLSVDSALGYSLGEMSMLFATGVWVDGDTASEALARSPLFSDRLAGPLNAVREAWGLPVEQDGHSSNLWANHVLMAPADRVLDALKAEERVYLTHINTPRQVVIGGEKEGCQRVIQALKSPSLKAPFSYALHCEAMKSEYAELKRLNQRSIQRWPDLKLYSADNYDLFQPEPDDIAHQVASSLCTHLDFPRLVRRAYTDGARIFIEVGAGGNCAKWIDDSLRGDACLTMSVNRKGTDDASMLVRTLAKLASHRVPVDLTPLYVKE